DGSVTRSRRAQGRAQARSAEHGRARRRASPGGASISGSAASAPEEYVHRAFAAVFRERGRKRGDVLARDALGEPRADLAAEDAVAARRVVPLAVHDEDAFLAARAFLAQEVLERVACVAGVQAVKIDACVDGDDAAPQPAKCLGGELDAAPFDVASVVFH